MRPCVVQGLENTARSSYLDLPTHGSAWPPVLRQGRGPLTSLVLWTDSRETSGVSGGLICEY